MPKKSFVEQVRNSQIKHPTQRGFSLGKWKKSFDKIEKKSKVDDNLYRAGSYFFNFLNEIRKKLNDLDDKILSIEKLRRSYIGLINRDYAVGTIAFRKEMETNKDFITFGSLIEKDLPVGPEDLNLNVMAIIEGSLDALKYPLSETFNHKGKKQQAKIDDIELLNVIRIKINLASLYNVISTFWAECLWNNWQIKFQDEYEIVVPKMSEQHICRVISDHRWQSMATEMAFHTFNFWEKLTFGERKTFLAEKRIIKIIKQNKRKIFKLGIYDKDEDKLQEMVMSVAAEETYWNELLEVPLPNYPLIKIRDLIKVWGVLYSLGRIMNKGLKVDIEVKKINTLIQYSPKFRYTELQYAIRKATGFSKEKVALIISICTFNGDIKQDLWVKPIIPIDENYFCPIIPALAITNRIRLIEAWMKEGGIDLNERGYAFEDHVRHEIIEDLVESDFMKNAYIHNQSVKLFDGTVEEEIDLVFIIGSSIILGEIKCSLFPSEPIETYRFFKIIDSASKQINRKADFVRKNKDIFLKLINKENLTDSIDKLKIFPIVITNLPYGSGLQINNVPITDQRVLSTYIGRTQDVFATQSTKDGKTSKQAIFYNSEEEAEKNIIPFLKNPLSVRLCRKILDHKIEQLPVFGNLGKKLSWLKIFPNEDLLNKNLWQDEDNSDMDEFVGLDVLNSNKPKSTG